MTEYKLKEKENGTFHHFDYLNALEMIFSRHYEKLKHPPKKYANTLFCKNVVIP